MKKKTPTTESYGWIQDTIEEPTPPRMCLVLFDFDSVVRGRVAFRGVSPLLSLAVRCSRTET